MQSLILTTSKNDKFEWKREKEYFPLFSFFITVVTIKKKDNLVDAFCKHQQIKEEVFLFQQLKRQLDSFVDRESRSALMELHTWSGLDLGFM